MQIRSAKAAHIKWKSFVQIALRGLITDDNFTNTPVVQTECDFGKWYYGDGMFLSMVPSFNALEEPHEMVHELYMQIYTLQKAKLKGGFFSNKARLMRKRQVEIARLTENFNDYTKILIESLQQLEIDILQMGDDELAEIASFS